MKDKRIHVSKAGARWEQKEAGPHRINHLVGRVKTQKKFSVSFEGFSQSKCNEVVQLPIPHSHVPHTLIHTYTHMYIHVQTQTHIYTFTFSHAISIHTNSLTHYHTHIFTWLHIHTYAYKKVHIYIYTYKQSVSHSLLRTRAHTPTYTQRSREINRIKSNKFT